MKRIEQIVDDICNDTERQLLSKFSSLNGVDLKSALDEKISKWGDDVAKEALKNKPLSEEYRALRNAKKGLSKGICDKDSITIDVGNYKAILKELDGDSWLNECESADVDRLYSIRSEIIYKWEHDLDKKRLSIILQTIDDSRNKLVKDLEDWLRLIESIKNSLDAAGMEPGYLWDLGVGNLTQKDIETLKEWASAFNKDPNVRKICELLGRLNASSSYMSIKNVSYNNNIPDYNSKDEISGIELGKDLENIIPSELTQMNDPDYDILFTIKYIENRLVCFSKQGYTSMEDPNGGMQETIEESNSGPIIFCIDTSGSMHGTPEYIAKAVSLYIAMKAMSQKRSCFLINFSTSIETIDLTPPKGIADLLSFMRKSFNGGTNATPALKKAIEMTNTESYRLADIIMISDFVMPPDSFSSLKKGIDESKKRKCRYHSLTIGNFKHSELAKGNVFDENWIYDTEKNSIEEIQNMAGNLVGSRYW